MEDRDELGRFKPGYSGGPGRPAGSIDILSAIRRKLKECPPEEERDYLELLIEKYINDAYDSGDGVAIRDLIDRFHGKPKQTVETKNDKEAEWLDLAKELLNEPEQKTTEDSEGDT